MHYNGFIMKNGSTQLTIRGLDEDVKIELVKKANGEGLSINRYIIKTIKRDLGFDEPKNRYKEIKEFLNQHQISKSDMDDFDEAITRSDIASKAKQKIEKL
jgi:hypothetical protein